MLFKKYDYETGEYFPIKYKDWKWQNTPFISLIEPSKRVVTAFCRPHGQVYSGYPSGRLTGTYPAGDTLIRIKRQIIDQYLAIQVCHGGNLANRITDKDK